MDTDDIMKLTRSGSLFCALQPKSMQKILLLRRLLCIDTPNVSTDIILGDEGVARCTDEDLLFRVLYTDILRGVSHHTHFIETNEISPATLFTTIEDEYFKRGNILYTKERPAVVPLPPRHVWGDTIAKSMDNKYISLPSLRVATGTALKSLAVIHRNIGNGRVPHRCSVQVLKLPNIDQAATVAINTLNPSRFNTTTSIRDPPLSSELLSGGCPMTREIVNNYRQSQHLVPYCCFGLYCPSVEDEERINITLHDKAPYTSSRWVGLYWVAGTTIPQLALVAGVTPVGMPKSIQVKGNIIIKEDDVLSIEVVPLGCDNSANNGWNINNNNNNNKRKQEETSEELGCNTDIVFFINGAEVQRIRASTYRPTCKYLEKCHFAVQLCTGAAVAVLNGECPQT